MRSQCSCYYLDKVSTHSRPKAAGVCLIVFKHTFKFQHTAARRRLGVVGVLGLLGINVSTHSRPKAAGFLIAAAPYLFCFNTQPPEGGWLRRW